MIAFRGCISSLPWTAAGVFYPNFIISGAARIIDPLGRDETMTKRAIVLSDIDRADQLNELSEDVNVTWDTEKLKRATLPQTMKV